MKFLFAFALLALASANPFLKPSQPTQELLEIQEIMAAIHSPSTHPATAAALEAHLLELLGITNPNPEPISVGPAIVDFDHTETSPVEASPAIVPPAVADAASSPLVQIVLNINQASSPVANPVVPSPVESSPVLPTPVLPTPVLPTPVLPTPVLPTPVLPTPVLPTPVEVVETAPEPVQVAEVAPVAPVVMPETLN